ncbi:LCP family protein [Nonomuraea sp. NPDC059194]|uniref:LCP family protein n=1 Tax=Nonomuraea sp. NPDC059194 TaxID=3346764 RepID=UPI0036BFC7FF
MDDLRMLRDFGDALEHEPPASLVRQRGRFMMERPPRRRTRLGGWPMLGLAAVATAAAVAVPMVVLKTSGPLADRTVAPPAGARPATKPTGALNVLLVGSDTRKGEGNAKYGPIESRMPGRRADTMILLHLSADGKRAVAVNLPRDSMVQLPSCDGKPGQLAMLNSSLNVGGLRCVWASVEKLTKVRIDHAVEVDFAGFKKMVDAVGTVRVKVPTPIDDKKSKLTLPAGEHELNGEQALGYFRLRAYGDGSDLHRIKRQHQLLAAMAEEVRSSPAKLSAFIRTASEALTTDEGLGVSEMTDIARGMSEAAFSSLTVPVVPYSADRNRLQWKQPEAGRLFKAIADDQPIGRAIQ